MTSENKGDFDKWREKQLEIKSMRRLRAFLKSHQSINNLPQLFDTRHDRQRIESLPEPNRTRLIDFIESKLGRRMKWRR